MEKLNISCIQTFIGFLHDICDTDRYGFLCPQMTLMVGHSADQAPTYISDWITRGKKLIYFAPYYQQEHWMLALIDIVEHNHIYWFDPIGNSEPSGLKTLLNRSIRVYGYKGGKRKSSKLPQWLKLNCARQPGNTKCGYYILRYMLEIVTRSDPTKPIDERFQDITSYSQEEIDEVRDLWTNYFLNV